MHMLCLSEAFTDVYISYWAKQSSFLLPPCHVLSFLHPSFPQKRRKWLWNSIRFKYHTYEKLMLASQARAIKEGHCLLFLCFHAGDLWLWSVSLEVGASYCRSDLFWWLSSPPPLLDASVACESNMQKDYT